MTSVAGAGGEMNENEQQQATEIRQVVTIPKDHEGVYVVSFPIAPRDSEYGDIEEGDRASTPHGNVDHALGSTAPAGELFRQASTVSGSKPSTPTTNLGGGGATSTSPSAPTSSSATTTQALAITTNPKDHPKQTLSEIMQHKIDTEFAGNLTSRGNGLASPMTAEELANNADLRLDNVAIDFQLLLACKQVSKRAKAARLLEYLEEAFSKVWLKSRHLAVIIKAFEAYGSIDRTDYFGSYRVDLIVTCFSRLVDVHNFEVVMTCLTAYEAACVYCRIGWLKIFNPMKPEGSYELDVSLWEERMIVKTLCTLATNEPGENWPCFSYRYSDNNNTPAEIIPGWSLTSLWLQDHAMPQRGVLSLLFYTGDGIGNFGCYAHVALRRALCAMFWVDEADHQPDYEVDQLDPNSATMALAMHRKDQKHRRGNTLTLEDNPAVLARINITDRTKARAQQESVHGKYWKVDKKTLGRTASVMMRDGPGDDMADMIAALEQDAGDNESSIATGPSLEDSNDDASLATSVSHESMSMGSLGLFGANRRSSYSIRRLSTHSVNDSHQPHALLSVKNKDNPRQASRGNLLKENSSHQLQSSNPHSELTPEQIAKLDHVKEQGLTFVDPEGGGEALTALLARMSSVSALSELKNTKNALDAKALAESDGTSETMQIILFPRKRRRKTNNGPDADNNRKSMNIKPGDNHGDKKNPDENNAAGPKVEPFFRLGEMFMKENPKSWLSYFYPSGGASGGPED